MVNISIAGLLIFLQLPIGLAPLLATGNSKNLARLFNRYFVTLEFFDEWLTSDPFDPSSKAFQTLSMVKFGVWRKLPLVTCKSFSKTQSTSHRCVRCTEM